MALKFYDAYHRTLRFEEVPLEQARLLWTKGRHQPLDRSESLALQDHLAWEIFRLAGPLGLPVHIHSSHGAGPFLRLQESDVRNLENVLADPRFGAEFVHLALSRHLREALSLALANMVRDGVVDETRAISIGRAVLRENARRLYGI